MHTYLDGRKDTFNLMQEHCGYGHQVQNFEDKTKWFTGCFILETGKFDEEKWKCCYDRCPLLNKQK